MSSKRPALSNLVVCSVFKLRQDHPEVYQAMGQDSAEDNAVSSYDVLSCLTGRDFEDCFTAVHKAESTGLVGLSSDTGDGWLTPQGHELMDAIPLDVLELCRQAANTLSYTSRDKLIEALDAAVPVQSVKASRISSSQVSADVDIDLTDIDFDDELDILDDDDDEPTVSRRPSSRV